MLCMLSNLFVPTSKMMQLLRFTHHLNIPMNQLINNLQDSIGYPDYHLTSEFCEYKINVKRKMLLKNLMQIIIKVAEVL